MGKEIRGITAKEARRLADESDFTLKHIYKLIRERAEENGTSTNWCFYDISDSALEIIKVNLKEDGFYIECTPDSLVIRW